MVRARWAALPDGLRATILYAGATGWTKGIGLLLLPLITGLLPAEFGGRLELLSSAAEIAAVLAGAGLVDTLYRFASLPGTAGRLGAARVTGLAVIVTLIGSGLASFALGTADRWFLAGSVPAEALGHYALASKLALAMAFLMQPFELWWYPRRLGVWAAADGALHSARLAGTGAAVTLLAAGVAVLAGPVLIRLATPVAYHPAAAMVPFVVVALVLQSFGSLFNIGAYIGRTGRLPFLVNALAGTVAIAPGTPKRGISSA